MTIRLISSILLFCCASALHAQTAYTWFGGTGDWEAPSNWTPNGVPAAADTAVINGGFATLNSTTSVAGFALNGGHLEGGGDLTVADAMTWTNGKVRGSATVRVAAGATLRITGPGSFNVDDDGTFVNEGEGVWDMPKTLSSNGGGDAQFVNEGTLELAFAASGGNACFALSFINAPSGLIRRVGPGEAGVACGFVNDGTVRIEQGGIGLNRAGTDTGAWEVWAGATLRTINNTQTIAASGSLTGEGTVDIAGGRLVVHCDATISTLLMNSNSGLGGSGTVTVTETLDWNDGPMQNGGTTVVGPDATLTIGTGGTPLQDTRTLRNEGMLTWSGEPDISIAPEAMLLNEGTTLSSGPGNRSLSGGGTLRNEGLFVHDEGTLSFNSAYLDNASTVRLDGGALQINSHNFVFEGGYEIADGATLRTINGAITFAESATLAGTGTLDFSGGTVTNAATWQPGASPGVLTVTSDWPGQTSTLEIELGGLAPGDEHDQLAVMGEAALSGTLRLLLTDGFVPEVGDAFTVLTADAVTGTFDAVEGLEEYALNVAYSDEDVTVTVAEGGCAEGLQPDAHTLALYKFDEASPGTSLDASGNGLHAIDDGTEVTEGRFCSARRFDGESDRIDMDVVREALQGATAWTIEYVARSEDGSQVPELVNHNCENGWWLGPRGGQSRYGIKTSSAGGFCAWTAEEFLDGLLDTDWHYYALTWDGATLSYYRDGVLRDNVPAAGIFEGSDGQAAWIGHSDSGSGAYTAGLADDLRVSTVARSADELCAISNALGFSCMPTAGEDEPALPTDLALHAPYPNPARRAVTLVFDLPEAQRVRLAVYDVLGREIAVLVEDERPAGRHEVALDAEELPSGVYVVRVATGGLAQTQRVTLLR